MHRSPPRRAAALAALLPILGCGQSSSSAPAGHDSTTAPTVTPDRPPPASTAQAVATATATATATAVATATAAPSVTATAVAANTAAPANTATAGAKAPTATAEPAPTVAPTATALASAAPTAAPTATAAAAPVQDVMSPKVVEGSYNVWMQSAGRYTAGQPGAVQIVLVAKGEYHCNPKYPYRFKLGAPSAGVGYPDPVARAISITPDRSIMTVPFVPSASGSAGVSGTFFFSVCSATTCQVESRDLALTVKVD